MTRRAHGEPSARVRRNLARNDKIFNAGIGLSAARDTTTTFSAQGPTSSAQTREEAQPLPVIRWSGGIGSLGGVVPVAVMKIGIDFSGKGFETSKINKQVKQTLAELGSFRRVFPAVINRR